MYVCVESLDKTAAENWHTKTYLHPEIVVMLPNIRLPHWQNCNITHFILSKNVGKTYIEI